MRGKERGEGGGPGALFIGDGGGPEGRSGSSPRRPLMARGAASAGNTEEGTGEGARGCGGGGHGRRTEPGDTEEARGSEGGAVQREVRRGNAGAEEAGGGR